MDRLSRLPLAQRQTAAHHLHLARAHQDANQPGPAAAALALALRLSTGQAPAHKPLRAWLDRHGAAAWKESAAAAAAGDRARAVRGYVLAVKCDPQLAHSAHPARALAREALEARVRAQRDDLEARWQLAWLLHRLGEDAAASYHFKEHADQERDPYRRWRSNLLARVTQPPSVAMLRSPAAAASTPPPAPPSADPAFPAPDPTPSPSLVDHALRYTATDPRVRELEMRLSSIDARISSFTSPGRYHVLKEGGKTKFVTQYDSRGAAALEDARREREQVAAELERARASAPDTTSGHLTAEEYTHKAQQESELTSVTAEIQYLESAGRDSRPIVDEQGKRRWVKPTDSRFESYLESLRDKKRKLEQELAR